MSLNEIISSLSPFIRLSVIWFDFGSLKFILFGFHFAPFYCCPFMYYVSSFLSFHVRFSCRCLSLTFVVLFGPFVFVTCAVCVLDCVTDIFRLHSSSSLASGSESEPTNCYDAIIKYLAHLGRRARRKVWSLYRDYRRRKHRSCKNGSGSGSGSRSVGMMMSSRLQPLCLRLTRFGGGPRSTSGGAATDSTGNRSAFVVISRSDSDYDVDECPYPNNNSSSSKSDLNRNLVHSISNNTNNSTTNSGSNAHHHHLRNYSHHHGKHCHHHYHHHHHHHHYHRNSKHHRHHQSCKHRHSQGSASSAEHPSCSHLDEETLETDKLISDKEPDYIMKPVENLMNLNDQHEGHEHVSCRCPENLESFSCDNLNNNSNNINSSDNRSTRICNIILPEATTVTCKGDNQVAKSESTISSANCANCCSTGSKRCLSNNHYTSNTSPTTTTSKVNINSNSNNNHNNNNANSKNVDSSSAHHLQNDLSHQKSRHFAPSNSKVEPHHQLYKLTPVLEANADQTNGCSNQLSSNKHAHNQHQHQHQNPHHHHRPRRSSKSKSPNSTSGGSNSTQPSAAYPSTQHLPLSRKLITYQRTNSRHCSAPTLTLFRSVQGGNLSVTPSCSRLMTTTGGGDYLDKRATSKGQVDIESSLGATANSQQQLQHSQQQAQQAEASVSDTSLSVCISAIEGSSQSGQLGPTGGAAGGDKEREGSRCSWSGGTDDDEEEDDEEDANVGTDDDGHSIDSMDDDHLCDCCIESRCLICLRFVRRYLRLLVNHRYFQRFIFLAILFNTLSMGIEYHNQPDELTQALEMSNLIFTFLFGIEMALKILADGCFHYISDGFNVFDGIVVVVSIMELVEDSGSGLSVLRTFRLLRILKLVRFMPALKRQLVIMLRTLDNVAVFFALLVLFIFIFSILGMNLFGCKFCDKMPDNTTQCDRKNFDSLLWALVTVFQILTQEDWNVVLFNGMERTTHWAALYFVVLMTFGNYVLFNLLVAILVEGFSQEQNFIHFIDILIVLL